MSPGSDSLGVFHSHGAMEVHPVSSQVAGAVSSFVFPSISAKSSEREERGGREAPLRSCVLISR